jgi:hypothetical protein
MGASVRSKLMVPNPPVPKEHPVSTKAIVVRPITPAATIFFTALAQKLCDESLGEKLKR